MSLFVRFYGAKGYCKVLARLDRRFFFIKSLQTYVKLLSFYLLSAKVDLKQTLRRRFLCDTGL